MDEKTKVRKRRDGEVLSQSEENGGHQPTATMMMNGLGMVTGGKGETTFQI